MSMSPNQDHRFSAWRLDLIAVARLDGDDPLGRTFTTFLRLRRSRNSSSPRLFTTIPTAVSPLSKQKPDDPEHVERFEIFTGGFELGNAFSELNDPVEQQKRFDDQLAERARRRRGSAPDGRGLRAGADVRVAADGRRRHRHRPAGDAADRIEVDSGCDSVSVDERRTGNRDQGTGSRRNRAG